jgi:hypothetical protein
MSKILEKIIEILKERKITYTFDNDLFELSVSSDFEGYIQLEKHDTDDDYSVITTYIICSHYNDSELMVQYYDDFEFEFDVIDEMVNGLIEDIKSVTDRENNLEVKLRELNNATEFFIEYKLEVERYNDYISDKIIEITNWRNTVDPHIDQVHLSRCGITLPGFPSLELKEIKKTS